MLSAAKALLTAKQLAVIAIYSTHSRREQALRCAQDDGWFTDEEYQPCPSLKMPYFCSTAARPGCLPTSSTPKNTSE